MAAALPSLDFETSFWKQNDVLVFGVDEAGRGCLAGPVCASVCAWAPHSQWSGPVVEVKDSKKMTEAQREKAFLPVQETSLSFGVGMATAPEIDRWNILKATHLAVARALEKSLEKFPLWPEKQIVFLADGNRPLVGHAFYFLQQKDFQNEFPLVRKLFEKKFQEHCYVQGDSKVFSIASASVLAKVSRDHWMKNLDAQFPDYKFAVHKGYGTELHREMLQSLGPCIEHRRSFGPVNLSLFPS